MISSLESRKANFVFAFSAAELVVVHEALDRLAAEDAPKAELVKLRFFIGLSNAEAAAVLGLSKPTTKRYWEYARAWLFREIKAILAEG